MSNSRRSSATQSAHSFSYPPGPRFPAFSSSPDMTLLGNLWSPMRSSAPNHNNLLVRTVVSMLSHSVRWLASSNANPACHKEERRSTGHIMVTTRYSDQQESRSRQKVMRATLEVTAPTNVKTVHQMPIPLVTKRYKSQRVTSW